MANKKPKAAQKKSGGAAAQKGLAKGAAKGKAKAAAAKGSARGASPTSPSHHLANELAVHLGLTEAQVVERALEDLAMQVGLRGTLATKSGAPHEQPAPTAAPQAEPRTASGSIAPGGYLPRRLYLSLDGRGLDGGGMPVEVIDVPFTIGSGRRNTVWVNQPQIETTHAQVIQTDDGWVFEDLGSEHGTFLNEKKIDRVEIHDGDIFLLAGYLRVKAALK